MQNLINDLKEALKSDERLVIEGNLNKAKIEDLALNLDVDLIKLLLKNDHLKQHFFQEADGMLIFDKIKFQKFISNKSFLPDSYTSFKNKIGLTANEQYIAESKEVVLAWPHKDCLLEGGQEKEEEKRDEIFWNEILAPDDIDRLLAPKVLTKWEGYDKDGSHSVTGINDRDNLIIKGNDLLALECLKEILTGKIKIIYIDPPYNTGVDTFLYNDRFNHSSWLTFMKNRLIVAKELLTKDGIIFISIGDDEVHYLKVLCDEIFGRDNFVSTVARVAKTASNKGTYFAPSIDFILCYAKQKEYLNNFRDEVDESLYKKVEKEGARKGERYRDDVALYQSALDNRPNQRYYIKCPDDSLVIPPGSTFPEIKEDGGSWGLYALVQISKFLVGNSLP